MAGDYVSSSVNLPTGWTTVGARFGAIAASGFGGAVKAEVDTELHVVTKDLSQLESSSKGIAVLAIRLMAAHPLHTAAGVALPMIFSTIGGAHSAMAIGALAAGGAGAYAGFQGRRLIHKVTHAKVYDRVMRLVGDAHQFMLNFRGWKAALTRYMAVSAGWNKNLEGQKE
jgi:hypothetical protein